MTKKLRKNYGTRLTPVGIGACLGGALLASSPGAWAQAETGNVARMDRLEKENLELRGQPYRSHPELLMP